jgi:adenylosuccinate lyase
VIRRHSLAAAERVKAQGLPNDLLARLRSEAVMAGVVPGGDLDPSAFVGRAPEQVDQFIRTVVVPIRKRYKQ